MFNLTDKIILITGASSGIGAATARMASDLGATIIASGRNEGRLEELVSAMSGEGHRWISADLARGDDRARLVENAGKCDGLVHAAGFLKLVPFTFIRESTLRETQAINYDAPILLTQALLKRKQIRPRGSIVFLTSIAGVRGAKGHTLYSGTKGALEAAARCLALELSTQKVRVNCVASGMVRTRMADEAASALGDETMRRHEEEYPLGFGSPEDVGGAVSFLLSGASGWITGTSLVVDGGFCSR